MNKPSGPRRIRPLPHQRKVFGTSFDVDGQVMVYTEAQVSEFGDACFGDGYRLARDEIRAVLANLGLWREEYSAAQRAEEDAWAEYNAGRGPHPTRR